MSWRWLTRVGLLAGLILSLFAVPSVGVAKDLAPSQAQATSSVPGTYSSSITVLNPSTNASSANVSVLFYDATGTLATTATWPTPVAPGGTAFWYVPNVAGLTAGMAYSAVVQSDQQVYATVNSSSVNPTTGEGYDGIDAGTGLSTSAYVPSVFQAYYGFTSTIVAQNASASALSNVTVTLNGASSKGAVSFTTTGVTIQPNASYTWDLASYATNLGSSFSGAATVNAGGNIAVISNNYTPSPLSVQTSYLYSSVNAFIPTAGNTTFFVPGLYQNYHGFIAALHVANADSVTNNVRVTYSNGSQQTASVGVGSSALFYLPNDAALPQGWLGSATVTSDNGKKLLATVDIQATGAAGVGLATYAGFASGTTNVYASGLYKAYHGFNSSLTIQNVDPTNTAPAGTVTVTFSDGHIDHNPTALSPGQSWQIYVPNESFLATGFNGGATVVSPSAKIVGLVNTSGDPTVDQLFSSNAFGSN
jgi:hypothetical protein